MLNFFKHKSFLKISTLLLISLSVFFFLFLKENLNFKISGYKEKNSSIINNIISDYNNFFEIKKITLNGRKEADLNKIKKIINSDLSEKNNLIEYDIRNIKISIENLKWIDKVFVRKVLPDQIIINIEEHKEFAVLNTKEKNFLLSDKGKIIYEIKNIDAYNLIHLEGSSLIDNIYEIKRFLLNNKSLNKEISKIIISPNNRWNVVINEILFKLPLENKTEAINQINNFSNLQNIEMVDLRFFEKKIFVKTKTEEMAMKNKK